MGVNKELSDRLFSRFEALVNRNHYWLSTKETLFSDIIKRYSEEHRFYHNLNHIAECLEEFDRFRNFLTKPDEVEMALFYHDIIYDVNKKFNEEASAKFMSNKLNNIGMNKSFVAGINDLIMNTWKHELGPHPDSGYMVDIDFSSLGAEGDKFILNRENIRKEYQTKFNDKEFLIGTIMFYSNTLQRKRIFLTDPFYELYEAQARENLKKGIELLEA